MSDDLLLAAYRALCASLTERIDNPDTGRLVVGPYIDEQDDKLLFAAILADLAIELMAGIMLLAYNGDKGQLLSGYQAAILTMAPRIQTLLGDPKKGQKK